MMARYGKRRENEQQMTERISEALHNYESINRINYFEIEIEFNINGTAKEQSKKKKGRKSDKVKV